MPLYEHVFLARQDASAQQVEELTTQMTGIVEQLGGKVVKMENWGVRSLTYRMNKNRKAHFVLLNIDGPSAAIAEPVMYPDSALVRNKAVEAISSWCPGRWIR